MNYIKKYLFVFVMAGFLPLNSMSFAADDAPRNVVVWISIDGVRGDYFGRSETPFFDRMMREGVYSLALAPVFPSLTFPNHVSQATGATVDQHGIPMNAFYDRATGRSYSFPGQSYLLEAEPIWVTTERQGRRTAVFDWVISYGAFDGVKPAYQGSSYAGWKTDRERVEQVVETWAADAHDQPLQLLMGYMDGPDAVGHARGPNSREVEESVEKADGIMGDLVSRAINLFNERKQPGDQLYIMVTSDHGMSEVEYTVNPYYLSGIAREDSGGDEAIVLTSGTIAHVFIHNTMDEATRLARINAVVEEARQHDFVDVYPHDDMPEHWGYNHPTRVGDVVFSLRKGYTFNRGTRGVVAPRSETGGHIGMHGYDVIDNPEMDGVFLLWRYPEPLGGHDLGATQALQLHATVARLLDVDPAPTAYPQPILW